MHALIRTTRGAAVAALMLLVLGLAGPAAARPDLAGAVCLYPAADPASGDLAAADAAGAGTLGVANAAVSSTDVAPTDVAPITAFGRRLVAPIGGACLPSSSWDISPAYTDTYYPDNATADRAEPPFPPVPTTTLPTWRNEYEWSAGHGYAGWHSKSSSAGGTYGMQSAFLGHYGLWLWPAGGTYVRNDYAEWTYTAPGTTRISTAKLWFLYRNKLLSHHCLEVGLRTADGTVISQNVHCKPTWRPDWQRGGGAFLADPSANPTATVLFFRIRLDCGKAASCSKTIPARNPYWNGAFARLLEADIKLVDDDQPQVVPSGPLADLANDYTDGRSVVPVTIDSSDAGAGIVRSWLERAGTDIGKPPPLPAKNPCLLPDAAPPSDGALPPDGSACCGALPDSLSCPPNPIGSGVLASAYAPCDPRHLTDALDSRICPAAFSFSPSIDLSPFPEGTNQFTASSIDPAGNVGSETWPVYIDRTPPSVPSGFAVEGADSDLGEATIQWSDSSDPALPDGVPGSGVLQYAVRYSINGGPFTDWDTVAESAVDLDDVNGGDTVAIEVTAIDIVGNESAAGTATLSIPTVSRSRGPVLTGRFVDGNGNPVAGEVTISLQTEDSAETPLALGVAGSDGAFAVSLTRDHAAAVTAEARANRGWVNFDIVASGNGVLYQSTIPRKLGLTGWSDGFDPAPIEITLAPGAPGVAATTPALRRLMGPQHRMQVLFCSQHHYKLAEMDKSAPVGELHTATDMHGLFVYGQTADSQMSIGFSDDGKVWRIHGSAHVGNTIGKSRSDAAKWNRSAQFGKVLTSEFHFVKYQDELDCFGSVTKEFRVQVKRWNGGTGEGADVHSLDNHCQDDPALKKNALSFVHDTSQSHEQTRSNKWAGGVSVFGASLDVESDFSKWVTTEWSFGHKLSIYWLCGNNAKPLQASRTFAGG